MMDSPRSLTLPDSTSSTTPAQSLPSVVSTLGLHGSASTWVFNVVRELIIDTLGDERTLALAATGIDQIPDEAELAGRTLIIKSHHGTAELDNWLLGSRARTILSVRDPRDASISMMERFKVSLAFTALWVSNDCIRLLRWMSEEHVLLRYEDRFFDDPTTVAVLARVLGVQAGAATRDRIFTRYRTEAVRSFATVLIGATGRSSNAGRKIHHGSGNTNPQPPYWRYTQWKMEGTSKL